MSWGTIIWSMTASACLTLALIHGFIWFRNRTAWANLLFPLTAVGTAGLAGCELAVMHAETTAEFGSAMHWGHLAAWVIVISLTGFVLFYLRAGRIWLAWAACGLRTLSLFLNFTTGQCLNYREITSLNHIPFLGESVSIAEGTPNPWMLVGQLSLLMFMVFFADAAITVWRRGDQRLALVVGGSITFFLLVGSVDAILVFWGIIHAPFMASLSFAGIVAAMGYELSRDLLRATQLARESLVHQNEVAHLTRVATLGELSSALAHELNQPLTAILSNAQAALRFLAQGKLDPEEIREILRDIVADDQRASEVIHRLRVLLKKGEFHPVALDVNELIQEALKLMNGSLTTHGVVVVKSFAAGLPPMRGDRVQLQQVLINLILNASDAMTVKPANARTLTIRSGRADDRVVQISVADTGSGIPLGSEEKIFEPYHTTKAQGLGLGLSLSRSIIVAHGGRLWAEIQAGGGAVFHFTLPVANSVQ